MPEYSFTVRSSDYGHREEHCAALHDASAALDSAFRLLRELSVKGCNDAGLLMTVRNEMRETVPSVPLLAAYA
jgi:hypothetical protein